MNQRIIHKFKNLSAIKQRLLNFSAHFETCNFYDSNGLKSPLDYGRFELLVSFGCLQKLEGTFQEITERMHQSKQWIMGYMSYDAHLKFNTSQQLNEADAHFYLPKIIAYIVPDSDFLIIESNGISDIEFESHKMIFNATEDVAIIAKEEPFQFKACTLKNNYLKNVERIKKNIVDGDYYELNYCQKFNYSGLLSNAIGTFNALNKKSPTPFSSFVKNSDYNILCTSPERFIYKAEKTLVSQPIKGTNKRLQGIENEQQLSALKNNIKELAENVMIVDLVRNDLSKICKSGSVEVIELCGTYPFALVNQMISTVKGELLEGITISAIFKSLFPMGSMTGAPKIEVMKNIMQYESTTRGIYSGCIGYIMPNGDFDFNVIIRSLVEDKQKKEISIHVGSAITYDSDPEQEFEECMLKAKGLFTF